jgi:hypothetical protein
MRRLIYLATMAGLTGLVVFHADDFARILSASTSTFRKAVNLA